jgi:hypothetical protein
MNHICTGWTNEKTPRPFIACRREPYRPNTNNIVAAHWFDADRRSSSFPIRDREIASLLVDCRNCRDEYGLGLSVSHLRKEVTT